jgi:hypothetical protein
MLEHPGPTSEPTDNTQQTASPGPVVLSSRAATQGPIFYDPKPMYTCTHPVFILKLKAC